MRRMKRREFLVKSSAALAGVGLSAKSSSGLADVADRGRGPAASPASSSRIVEVFHPSSVLEGRRVDEAAVRSMVRRGVRSLAGKDDPWAAFLKPGDRVGLKINTLGRPLLVTHRELVAAFVAELTAFGIKDNDIVVWDRWQSHMTASGYILNATGEGVRCYGTEGRGVVPPRIDPEVVYVSEFDTPEGRDGGRTESRFSSIFTRECDKIINLAILKDHDTSGYTMCLKNLAYGLCDNNSRFHKPPHIGPFIAGFCAQPRVREKVVLHVIDALEACYDLGPVPSQPKVIFAPRTIWLGTDPVALDAVGYRVLDAKRVEEGLPRLKDSAAFDGGPRPVDHIHLAAAKGVGIADIAKVTIDRIDLSAG